MTDEDDRRAAAFCDKLLARNPATTYREARKLAWEEGFKVTRKAYSQALRDLHERTPNQADPPTDAASPAGVRSRTDARRPPAADRSPDKAPPTWNTLFSGQADAPADAAASPKEGEDATESAKRALGLLSSPPAVDAPRINAVEFMAGCLRERPDASYKEIREQAENQGYTVSTAAFGRAQAIVGILGEDEDHEGRPMAPLPTREEVRRRLSPRRGRKKDPALLLEEFILSWQGVSLEHQAFRKGLKAMLKVVERALREG